MKPDIALCREQIGDAVRQGQRFLKASDQPLDRVVCRIVLRQGACGFQQVAGCIAELLRDHPPIFHRVAQYALLELQWLEVLVGKVSHGFEGGASGAEGIRPDVFEALEVGLPAVGLVQNDPVAGVAWDSE